MSLRVRHPASSRALKSAALRNSAGFPEIAYSQTYLVDDEIKTRRAALRKLPASLWQQQPEIIGPFNQGVGGWKLADIPHGHVLRETTRFRHGGEPRVNYFIVAPSREFTMLLDGHPAARDRVLLDKGRDA